MIIKITTIGSAHAGNAINYAMNKEKKERGGERPLKLGEQPFILATCGISTENFITGEPDANDVWLSMKLQQAKSKHRIKDGFFRVEICPAKEECQGWKPSDWRKMLDDAIRVLDSMDFKNKKGKVVGKHTDFAHSQWVAAIHRDTDNWHIHLIVNRITMNDGLQDANRIRERGMMAANTLSIERGWTKAEDKQGRRKTAIHNDAIEVLRNMSRFSFDEYFKQMRLKGWIVETKQDSKGYYRGYSIGEQLYKKGGGESSVVMCQSSKIGFGRDLMVSKLPRTWKKLHVLLEQEKKMEYDSSLPKSTEGISKSKNNTQENCMLNTPGKQNAQTSSAHTASIPTAKVVRVPQWECSTYRGKENWNDEGTQNVRIPDAAFAIIDELVKPLDRLEYWDRDENLPSRATMVAVAVFEFCTAADAQAAPGGGGGGSNDNDLRWDGMTKSDFEKMAEMAIKNAMNKCTSHLTRRRGRGFGR